MKEKSLLFKLQLIITTCFSVPINTKSLLSLTSNKFNLYILNIIKVIIYLHNQLELSVANKHEKYNLLLIYHIYYQL